MIRPSADADGSSQIRELCAQFLGQVRLLLPLERLDLVVLDAKVEGRPVIFNWPESPGRQAAQNFDMPVMPLGAPQPQIAAFLAVVGSNWSVQAAVINPSPRTESLSITLKTGEEILGVALLRGPTPQSYGVQEEHIARQLAQTLALSLENLRLRQLLVHRVAEVKALMAIGEKAVLSSTFGLVCREFARHTRNLVEFSQLGIYALDSAGKRAKCVFATGQGAHQLTEAGGAVKLCSWLEAMFAGQPCIVGDLLLKSFTDQHYPVARCSKLLRSQLAVPIIFGGSVVGAVRVSHPFPNSYQRYHQEFLQQAANHLGKSVAAMWPRERNNGQSAATTEFHEAVYALACSSNANAAFPRVAEAITALVPVDWVRASWRNASKKHTHSVEFGIAPANGHGASQQPAKPVTLHVGMSLDKNTIGRLVVERRHSAGEFTAAEKATLIRLAAHLTQALQSYRLRRHAMRQACQLRRLQDSHQELHDGAEPGQLERELLAELTHSFRNPLTSIKGYSTSLLQPDMVWPPEVQRQFLQTIDQESDKLSQVVEDLLDTFETEELLPEEAHP
ncbi:MAG: GAF domain-containing protein [SAR202 cluster bacterium]|nr:GAF domain-containing protein [SAR202 cluster bacterium]